MARASGFDAEVISALEVQCIQRKEAKALARPFGARLDSAHARVARCKLSVDKAVEKIAAAKAAFEEAQNKHAERLQELFDSTDHLRQLQASAHGPLERMPATPPEGGLAAVLETLIVGVEKAYTAEAIPQALASALQTAKASLSPEDETAATLVESDENEEAKMEDVKAEPTLDDPAQRKRQTEGLGEAVGWFLASVGAETTSKEVLQAVADRLTTDSKRRRTEQPKEGAATSSAASSGPAAAAAAEPQEGA